MDRLINFRASSAFLSEVRQAAEQRGVPVSRLIREAVHREIQQIDARAPRRASRLPEWTTGAV